MGSGIYAGGAVDDQPDLLGEQCAVVDLRVAGAGHELVQPDPVDEPRTRIDQRDVHIGAHPQPVGRQRSGIATADHDNLVRCAVFRHASKTPQAPQT
ncbi:hypothetical protein IU438_19860 [Nocardia cyriacigeorgica]|nr:hypothetical protein [Nocardia cyriacigeorgica]MBF6095762.1 hypothetical protein [Nocardia cyriacigeorgica]MBF6398042.1 hypothetical protein [Nocardia cyriacigeorgica]MBF6404444.1 hypothetical protein [Nocardia cyriacigeorgica]